MEVDCKNAKIIRMEDSTLTVTFKYNSMAYNALLLLRPALKNDYCRNRTSKPRKPRTTGKNSQNHAINGYIAQICVETGNDFHTVKDYCKKSAVSEGYPFDTFNGEVFPWSETRLDTLQANILRKVIIRLADELRITLKEYEED